MATDYLYRMYWPNRGAEAGGEARTTYGKTIALTAQLRRQNETKQRSQVEQLESYSRQLQPSPQRTGSRMFQRRLPALPHTAPVNDPQSKYDDRYQYTMNRVRGLQSQVPLSRSLDPSSQQISLRGTPGSGARRGKPLEDYRLRQGRAGGVWKHVKEVLQSKGSNIMYVDGTQGIDENRPTRRQARVTSGLSMPELGVTKQKGSAYSHTYQENKPLKITTMDEYRGMEASNWQVMR